MRTALVLAIGSVFLFTLEVRAQGNASSVSPQEMLEQVDQKLKEQPSNPRLLAARGAVLEALHRDAEALRSFSQALAISPKFLAALEGAAEISYRTRGAKTKEYLARILEQDPHNVTVHAMNGELAFEAADCVAANRDFALAGEVVNSDATALQHWGECLLRTGDASTAALRLQAALRLAQDDHVIYELGVALFMDRRYEPALDTIKAIPEDGKSLNLTGNIYAAQEKLSEAIAAFRKASELNPKDEQNYVDLASLCLEHQSFDVAREVVNAGIANIPDSAALFTLRGAIAAQTSDVEQSAADFERARRLEPNSSYGDVGLSLLLRQGDQIDQATALIRKRLGHNPGDARLNFLLAELLAQGAGAQSNARKAEIERLLRKAIRADAKLAKAHAALGKLLLQGNRPGDAAMELRRALDEDPADRVALNQYILAMKRLHRVEEANAAAQRLREVLAQDRRTEVRRNRVRLILPSDSHP